MEFTITSKKHGTHTVYVDDEDWPAVKQHTWRVQVYPHTENVYAKTNIRADKKVVTKYLHAFITGYKQTDHINGCGLDNRRANLRPATSSQNQQNRKMRKDNASGYKGVSFCNTRKKWVARVNDGTRYLGLGYFDCPVKAAHAYNKKAGELFGEFARLNDLEGKNAS